MTEHSRVLLYYHPKKDLIGIKLRVIRGAYDVSSKPPTKKKRLYCLKNLGKTFERQAEDDRLNTAMPRCVTATSRAATVAH